MRRALLAAALLLVVACNNGPTEPNRTETLTGTLARSASTTSSLVMHDTGNVQVRAVDLKAVAADGTTSAAEVTLSIGTGDATNCTVTGNFGMIETSLVSLGLTKGNYCVKLTEPTVIAEGSSVRYTIRLEITD